MKLKTEYTGRGFAIIRFEDRYGVKCSIQKSSLMGEDAIWFGTTDPDPRIMLTHARRLGVDPGNADNGWVSYPIPPEVLMNDRMHLNVDQVKALIPILQHFVDTGELIEIP